ncbi:MAG: helix-turn-helix domain-containing protein [Actinomycetales bacterium]|uniref:Helix-turn-helix domain-containing protein n=1 Tax=Candidatus Phosphoribacter hodrii TaxID=2953743 RepID=A0A935CD19_9MICO|nr:helix-turn-helix domain-containing protein [Candidatus Phosphoribacter hodrii]
MTDKLLMTKRETAALLGVSVRTVERLVTSGSLSPVQVSRSVRFLRADLDTYLACGPVPSATTSTRRLQHEHNPVCQGHPHRCGRIRGGGLHRLR